MREIEDIAAGVWNILNKLDIIINDLDTQVNLEQKLIDIYWELEGIHIDLQ